MDVIKQLIIRISRRVWTHMKRYLSILILMQVSSYVFSQQPPQGLEKQPPDPGVNRIEVRFASGNKAILCKSFYLSAKVEGRKIIEGKYSSGFTIPASAMLLPKKDLLELELKCGEYRWHFTEVGERAFSEGYWWVGTSYPPFLEEFQAPSFGNSAWIQYLIVKPSKTSGFIVYKHCPNDLKDKKPGPCYEE